MSHNADINDTSRIPKIVPQADVEAELPAPHVPEIIIVTGMSGAGRSRAAATLEDLGWYVVDNLPPRLLKAMSGLISADGGVTKLCAVVDVRSREFFAELVDVLGDLRVGGIAYRLFFMDASDQVLVQRYESVRRPHLLQGHGRLLDGILKERKVLAELKKRADSIIDTSTLSVHDLARKLRKLVGQGVDESPTQITVMSFGFKYGLPLDADNVADVRFLPNPYWVSELRHLTGHDEPVANFVLEQDGATWFVEKYSELIEGILDGYARELKPFTTIAIGCTGGKHRSVAIAEAISKILRNNGRAVRTIHRDLGRE
ncbi:RNase adapter RapZ [Actinotignum urinale]|uniref:RNase adapter RapZ n=1 Tax=Actinotignum urinale TaxID=190146 RepID=UPI002A815AA3|nr:RNase adapter RapZ [Actinotignum urinale]MDY5152150.1 RNase adapter RapZ [Actinotignum urinale]